MRKDRLTSLTLEILLNYPSKRQAIEVASHALSPWAQGEWGRARKGASLADRAAILGHSISEQRRCDEALIAHIYAALDGRTFHTLDATYCVLSHSLLSRQTGNPLPPALIERFTAQPLSRLLLNARTHQDLRQRGLVTIADLLPLAEEWLSVKRLAPGQPIMSVRLSILRCLRILGVDIALPQRTENGRYCPACEQTETELITISAYASV